jgi:hypothetical protein
MHSWSIFGAWTSHEQTQIHKTHHGMDLGEATTFPFIIFYMPDHRAYTQMSFCFGTPKLGVSKFPKLGLLRLWKPITFCEDLQLRWGLTQSCSPCQELSNDMWHATCTKINYDDSWLLVVGNQISNLTPGPSFGHKLYFKYPKWVIRSHFKNLRLKNFPMV